MKTGNKYDVTDLVEAQFQPGSYKCVLINIPGIKRKREMEVAEAEALTSAIDKLFHKYDIDHRFTASDISYMHKLWLGGLYEWAGNYRQVNVSKDGFTFAVAGAVPKLMDDLEAGPLNRHTPCKFNDREMAVTALAEVHVELLLIHPFREGNGRIARVLATLMALQAGLPILDFSSVRGRKREEYFRAVRAGMDKDYMPMEKIFRLVLERTLKIFDR